MRGDKGGGATARSSRLLGAPSAGRSQLDAGHSADPRAELLFHDRLELLERQLTHVSDPTATRFTGGPPPSAWVA